MKLDEIFILPPEYEAIIAGHDPMDQNAEGKITLHFRGKSIKDFGRRRFRSAATYGAWKDWLDRHYMPKIGEYYRAR